MEENRVLVCCGWSGLDCRSTATFAGFGGLHLESVVETVEVVKQADCAEQLNDFTFRVKAAELGELLVTNGVSVARDRFSEAERCLFSWREVCAAGPFGKVGELVVSPAEPTCEDGVACETVWRAIHLTGADDDELFEFGGDGTCVEDSAEMRLHGGEDFRSVSHDAEHIGHVAALGKNLIKKGGKIGGDFAAVEA